MKDLKALIIGCGNMGSAIAEGIAAKGILKTKAVFLYDKLPARAKALAKKTGCIYKDLPSAVRNAGLIIIAVKPQDSDELFDLISENITKQTIVSVMAGVSMGAISSKVGRNVPIARVMPNIAALTGEGMSVISFNRKVVLKKEIKAIFSAIGKVLELDEAFMNKVTAVSGSGPAYLFYLADAMIEAAKEMGMREENVKDLVAQTLYGSALMLKKAGYSPLKLIEKVASKGGTTAAALSVFDDHGLKDIIKKAVEKAEKRAKELSSRG